MKEMVLLTLYNVAKHISGCIESVLFQTYPILKCLIIDDGSIIRVYNNNRIHFVQNDYNYLYRFYQYRNISING